MPSTPKTQALEEWLRSHSGYLHENIRISNNATCGIHYRAIGPIDPGTTIASTPHSLALSYLNALVDDAFPVFRQQRHQFEVEAIGFFYLMAQYIDRERSFWRPYLDTLPDPEGDFTQPLFFEAAEDVSWLEGTDVWHTVSARKQVYERYHHDGIAILKAAGVDTGSYTWHLFKWAATMFTSRSFTSRALHSETSPYCATYKTRPDGHREAVVLDISHLPTNEVIFPVLFPGLDAANHSHDARVDWTFDPGRVSIGITEPIESGAEVFNNYGPKGNDELLIGYGFCIPNNPHDTVALTLKAPPEELQRELRTVQSRYFTAAGTWNFEKATFRLQKAAHFSEPSEIFHHLPEQLLELLIYMLHHERGLPFRFLPHACEYLLSGSGSRYRPHIARIVVEFLAPKLARLQQSTAQLPPLPQNNKQTQALIYRESQIQILESLISASKSYTRSVLHLTNPPSSPPYLATLETLLSTQSAGSLDTTFLPGIAGSANTQDLSLLRQAGWEEDIFVLLLCYLYLANPNPFSDLPPYIDPNNLGASVEAGELEQAKELIEIVRVAARTCPDPIWGDERWSAEFIAGVGGRIVRWEGFVVMCPTSAGDDGDGDGGGEEARLCVYMHGL